MTQKEFIAYLQQLLTLVKPGDACSEALARTALLSMVTLAMETGKVDRTTTTMMKNAVDDFDSLLKNRSEFIGTR